MRGERWQRVERPLDGGGPASLTVISVRCWLCPLAPLAPLALQAPLAPRAPCAPTCPLGCPAPPRSQPLLAHHSVRAEPPCRSRRYILYTWWVLWCVGRYDIGAEPLPVFMDVWPSRMVAEEGRTRATDFSIAAIMARSSDQPRSPGASSPYLGEIIHINTSKH